MSAQSLERLREADQRNSPSKGVGCFVRNTPNGSIVTPWRSSRRRGGEHPFKVLDCSDDEGLKIHVHYGAVIDMTDWHEPKVIVPKIGLEDNIPDSEGRRPKLGLPQSEEIDVFVVIQQGEHGRVDDSDGKAPEIVAHPANSMPEIENGTLYVHIARIKTVENESEGEDEPSRRIEQIYQILGSHIVWPFKPDFVGWQQRNDEDESKAALWLGAGSEYIEDCDKLEDLYVKVQREDFDNGRDGDTVFELSMPEDADKQSVLVFDKNQERGIELRMSEGDNASTSLTIDRKSTASSGAQIQTNQESAKLFLSGPNEDSSVTIKAAQNAKASFVSPNPEISLEGPNASTVVSTVEGKEIRMREIAFVSPDGTPMKAWFLASEPEPTEPDSNTHTGHHAEHYTEHGTHHMGHYVDPDHDPDDSGLSHGSHHAAHHLDHTSEEGHDNDEGDDPAPHTAHHLES